MQLYTSEISPDEGVIPLDHIFIDNEDNMIQLDCVGNKYFVSSGEDVMEFEYLCDALYEVAGLIMLREK
jgi:hypothetical protein